MTDDATAQLTADILLEIQAVHIRPDEPFTFTSGRLSPVYVDCRKIISFPRARAKLMEMAVERVCRDAGHEAFDVVAGGETAGIPFAAWVSERLGLPMTYIRKKPKGFGTRTPAATSWYSASTSVFFQASSCSLRPYRVLLAIARAWRLPRTLRPSWYWARCWKLRCPMSL